MPSFSPQSLQKLNTCHPDLIKLFTEVVKGFDCTIVCGHRGQAEQDAAVAAGNSQTKWPTSKHNTIPSLAVDVMPSPINWEDTERMIYFAGYVKATAEKLGIKIRLGLDWNSDTQIKNETFKDYPHYEIA